MSTKIGDLVKTQYQVVVLHTKDTVETALEKLENRHITSAPVLDEKNKIWGFLDVVDLMLFLVRIVTKTRQSTVSPPSDSLTTDDIAIIARRSAEFSLSSLFQVISSSPQKKRNDSYYPLTSDMTLQDAVEIFVRGVHRIAMTNNANKIVHILTQFDIMKYLVEDTTRMGLKAEIQVGKINLLQKEIISVLPETKTVDAFKAMAEHGLNSIAIINKEGVILGSLSSTDMKGLREFQFMRLLWDVSQFLSVVRKEQGRDGDFLVCCGAETQLKRVVEIIYHEHVHRIYIVDDNKRPLGVISQTDIIRECFI